MSWPRTCIATSQCIVVCEGSRILETLHRGAGLYYGVTWSDHSIYFSARHGYGHLENGAEVVYRVNDSFGVMGCYPLPFAETHQMHWTPEGLLLAKTCFEQVLRIRETGYDVIHQGGPQSHVNSVWVSPEGAVWFVEHNRTTQTGVGSRILCGDLQTGHVECATLGEEVHNVFSDTRGVYALSSGTGEIVRQFMFGVKESTEKRRVAPPQRYLRGMAVIDDYIIVGASAVGARDIRHDYTSDAKILLLSRETLEVLDCATIPGVGQVGDIRGIGGSDEAHNGLPMPTPC